MEYKTENQIPYNIYDKINIYLTGYGPKKLLHIYSITVQN